MKKALFLFTVFILFCYVSVPAFSQNKSKNKKPKALIDISNFFDSSHHWYDITDEDKEILPAKDQKRYVASQIKEIADNIVLFQRDNGGWAKNYDMLAVLTPAQRDIVLKSKTETHTTFDNGTTHSQIQYLAKANAIAPDPEYVKSCLMGLDYILLSQYSNGGWPQFFPDTDGYAKEITFNDGAMIGIMEILRDIVYKKPVYHFVDAARRQKIKTAFEKGLDCILKCQISDDGVLNAWCQQYDNLTLKPAKARTFEPACICNGESSDIVLFLMSLHNPSPAVVRSIEAAVAWFEKSKILNTRIDTIPYPETVYKYRTSKIDRVVVHEPNAKPIWTRYYELGTHRSIFSGRDSKIVYSMAEVEHERRSGYRWYVYEPQKVLNKYSEWKKALSN